MHYIQGTPRSEIKMFPEVENWVSQLNPVRLIDLFVEKAVLSNPYKYRWKGETNKGRTAYSPLILLKLFLYGYLYKIVSSRNLETDTYRNIELMWLINELHPDHWTINEYRKRNSDQIRSITLEFRRFLKAEGYITGKEVATDGSKFKAYSSKDMISMEKIMKRLSRINEKLDDYLEQLKQTDTIEDLIEEFSDEHEGIEINRALIDKISDLQDQVYELESYKIQLEESGKKYISANDPDASLMKSRHGKIPAYNVQTVVDNENRMIATAEVTTSTSDINELKNNYDTLKEQLDIEPEILLADKGYSNLKEIKEIEESSDTKCIIPLVKSSKKESDKKEGIHFTYNKEKDEYQCSQGRVLKLKQKNQKRMNIIYNVYQGIDCSSCLIKSNCTKSKIGRIIKRNVNEDWIATYKKRLLSVESREKIKKRKTIVEHPFGTIKWMMGQIHFLLTGKEKVQIEIDLYTTAYNFKRLINIDKMDVLLQKVNNYAW